jgi:hypothetical protein
MLNKYLRYPLRREELDMSSVQTIIKEYREYKEIIEPYKEYKKVKTNLNNRQDKINKEIYLGKDVYQIIKGMSRG